MRKRLRPAHGKRFLRELYNRSDEPLGHADHRLRIPLTAEVGAWLIGEHRLSSLADLSCGYDALTAAAVANGLIPWDRVVLGDYGEVSPRIAGDALTGPIEDTIGKIDPVDLFVCTETIEHLDDPDDTLSRIRQKTRFLLLSTPVGSWHDPTPGHYWAWDRDGVELVLEQAGFEPVVYAQLGFAAADLPQTFGIWGAR